MKGTVWIATYMIYVLLGGLLITLGLLEKVGAFWSGMGSALLVIGVLRLLRMYRLRKNEGYRERVETAQTDERNRFIRNKAWAWAGYLFVIITAVAVIVLHAVGQEQLGRMAAYAECLLLVLYWICYLILRKKY